MSRVRKLHKTFHAKRCISFYC